MVGLAREASSSGESIGLLGPRYRSDESPGGTAEEEKSKPSMLCKKRKGNQEINNAVEEGIQMDEQTSRSFDFRGKGSQIRRSVLKASSEGHLKLPHQAERGREGKIRRIRNGRPRRGPKEGRGRWRGRVEGKRIENNTGLEVTGPYRTRYIDPRRSESASQ